MPWAMRSSKLNEKDVVAAARHLKKCGVKAVAVCLLWSIVNPAHERRVREILQKELAGHSDHA